MKPINKKIKLIQDRIFEVPLFLRRATPAPRVVADFGGTFLVNYEIARFEKGVGVEAWY